MRRWAFLAGVMVVLVLLHGAAAPTTAGEKAVPHEQPIGDAAGGLVDYSTFNNPDYYYAGLRVPPTGTYYRQAGLSPDGTRVVAQKSWNDGSYNRTEIVLMDADGSGEVVISPGDSGTGDIYGYMNPFWSDDGTAVGFSEVHNSNPNKVVRYDVGPATRTYLYEPVAPADANNPDFLGSSLTTIVFWDYGTGGSVADLFIWDGSARANITNSAAYKEYEPVSNADGSVILYWSGETTAEPVNTTHTLTYSGGTWTKDAGFSPIPDSYWSYWMGPSDALIGTTVMSSKDVWIYDDTGAFVADLTGSGYSGGAGQWNFFGSNPQGPDGEIGITTNAGRGGSAGRDIVVAADRSALFVDDAGSDGYPGTRAAPFASIQKGINEVLGSTVTVGPGTYAEDLVIDKSLSLVCPNAGIDPNSGSRGPEAVLMPATNGWDAWGTILYLQASHVTIDGCTFDGDNPLLGDGYPMGGADINANAAIDTGDDADVDHLVVQNNIIQNLLWSSIYLSTPYGENHSSNYIVHNQFDNIWEGMQIYAAETDVSDNVFHDVTRGISYHQVSIAPDPGFVPRIADNEVNVLYNWEDTDRNVGIWVNGRHGTAAPLSIGGNTVNTPAAAPAGKAYWGYALYAVTGDRVVNFTGNTVNGYGNCDVGLWAWYVDSSNPVVLGGGGSGGLYDIKSTGVLLSNYHDTWGLGPTALTLSGLPITVSAGGTPVRAWEGATEPSGGPVEPSRNGRSLLAPDHRVPEASDTTLTITGGTYSGGAVGIDVDGATATVTGATITGNGTGVYVHNGGSGDLENNCISGNASFGANNSAGVTVDARLNWWGDASGPYHATSNPGGLGDEVSDDVDTFPWLDTCGGSAVDNFQNVNTGAYYTLLQDALDAALPGHTILTVGPGPFGAEQHATVTKSNVTIKLNGRTFGPGSPWLVVNADDVAVLGPGVVDGWNGSANSPDPGIKVLAGADNLVLQGVEVKRWQDGVELAGSVTSFKIGGNWIHSNTDAGLQIDGGVSLGGVVTIKGNLFKANGGNGIQNDGATHPLPAEYNSWGHLLGPASGDGASSQVDYAPFTFAEPFLDMAPETEATEVDVVEGDPFDVKLKMDAAKVYGFSFKITYDTDWLTLAGVSFSLPWSSPGRCTSLSSTPGEIQYRCNLQYADPEWDADGGTVATLSFTAALGPEDEDGPWPTTLDILHDPELTKAGAIGGERIFVNNAGYNDPSIIPDRDVTDTNDGLVNIVGLANYTGFVDLQGRLNDGGAVCEAHSSSTYGSTLLASGTSASSGACTTAHTAGNRLLIGQEYWLIVDRELYLPTTVLWPSPTPYEDSKALTDRPLTSLGLAFLLGGDATDSDHVDINDATCIGWDYGGTVSTCTNLDPLRSPDSDVNGDGLIDLYDLVLMGTNYTLSYSAWTP